MTDPINEVIRVIDSVNQRISDVMKGVYERAAVRRNAILAAGFKFPLTVSTADSDYNAKEVERLYECAESLYMAAYRAGAADMKEKCAKVCLEQDEYGCTQYADAIRALEDE